MMRSQFRDLRQHLEARARTLREAIHDQLLQSDNKAYGELAGRVLDPGEQAVADVLADASVAELRSETAALADIVAAQRRIDEGSYGICLDCNSEIDARRLQAQPTAMRCTACQSRYENIARDRTPSL